MPSLAVSTERRNALPAGESVDGSQQDGAGVMSRPVMKVLDADLAEATLSLRSHLVAQNEPPTLFLYGDVPVRVEQHPETLRFLTRPLTVDRLRYHVAECIQFVRPVKGGGQRGTEPPIAWVRNLLAAPDIGLPVLTRIVETPVFGVRRAVGWSPGKPHNWNPVSAA